DLGGRALLVGQPHRLALGFRLRGGARGQREEQRQHAETEPSARFHDVLPRMWVRTALDQRRPTRAMVVEGRNTCKIAPISSLPIWAIPTIRQGGHAASDRSSS